MFSQNNKKQKPSIKYPIRKVYSIFLGQDTNFEIFPYQFIDNAIEIECKHDMDFFSFKERSRIWAEDGKLEILDVGE